MGSNITSDCTIKQLVPGLELKAVVVETPATANNTDTVVLDLETYGIKSFIGALTWIQSTANSVITVETTDASTTAVSAGDLTLTIAGSTSGKKRTMLVLGF